MKMKFWVFGVLGVAVLLVVVAMVIDLRTGSVLEADNSQVPTSSLNNTQKSGSSPSQSLNSEQPAKSSKSQTSKPSEATEKGEPKASESPKIPSEATRSTRLEVPSAQPSASRSALPKSTQRKPALSLAPKDGVAEGKLTKGFPSKAIPVPESTTIISSSVANQPGRIIAGLQGRSTADIQDVIDFYEDHFNEKKWVTTQSSPSTGITTLLGQFGEESTTVTLRQLPTGATEITVAGAFKVEK